MAKDGRNAFIEDTDERKESHDEKMKMMEEGDLDEDTYSNEGREKLVEDGEMEDWEEGFSKGTEDGGRDAKCRYCGKVLVDKDDVFEKKIDGELCFFCSEEHIDKYLKKKGEES